MTAHDFLLTAFAFLLAAVVAVPLFRRWGLAAVLGYLAAGAAVGPQGLGMVQDVKATMSLAELGVVFLLFVIGLELKPSRLWVLRKSVFGMGGLQVFATTALVGPGLFFLGFSATTSILLGVALSFSSTAFALQLLAEKKQLATLAGRSSFSILLFQDLAAIPLIAMIPLLGAGTSTGGEWWVPVLKTVGIFVVLVLGGRYALRPALDLVAKAKTPEIFTAAALLLVVGVSLLMELAGLSMALGSFLAGVLLADSEYRHELESDIEPFKGLLLGLFFMAVGMGIDFGILFAQPLQMAGAVIGLMLIKTVVLYGVSRLFGIADHPARQVAFMLPQAGEFAFVVFAALLAQKLLESGPVDFLVLTVTLSMVATPALVWLNERFLNPRLEPARPEFDRIENEDNQIIIAGFGRFGQIVGRLLRVLGIGFTALENDANQVEVLRKFGAKVYFGDATKPELLKAAGAERAKILVVAIDKIEDSLKAVDLARSHYPHLVILARARNRKHVFELLDRGVTRVWRETLGSSLEMAESLLGQLGIADDQARLLIRRFRSGDESMLLTQYQVHLDEDKMASVSREANAQLIQAMMADLPAEKRS